MDAITAAQTTSPDSAGELAILVNCKPLDEFLAVALEEPEIKGLVATLLPWLDVSEGREVVWRRILPAPGERAVCPLLMCPDDCDLWCTLVVAEVEATADMITWRRFGLDRSPLLQADGVDNERVGSDVAWRRSAALAFGRQDYEAMVGVFREALDAAEADL